MLVNIQIDRAWGLNFGLSLQSTKSNGGSSVAFRYKVADAKRHSDRGLLWPVHSVKGITHILYCYQDTAAITCITCFVFEPLAAIPLTIFSSQEQTPSSPVKPRVKGPNCAWATGYFRCNIFSSIIPTSSLSLH